VTDVSIVIAAYNAARTIEASIRSVLAQATVTVEVLVCDDASTDGTAQVVEAIEDPRVRLVRNASNLGPGGSRNRLMRLARGDYVAFLDADDQMAPERLATMLGVAREHPGALVFDDILECHDLGVELRPFRRVHGGKAFAGPRSASGTRPVSLEQLLASPRLLVKPVVPTHRIRAEALEQSHHRYGEDGLFLWRALARGIPAIYVPSPMYLYRVTPGSLSANTERHALVADCLRLAAEEPGASQQARQHALSRAREYEDLATLRAGRGPTLGKALRYFAGNPVRFPRWLLALGKHRLYALARWRARAPGR